MKFVVAVILLGLCGCSASASPDIGGGPTANESASPTASSPVPNLPDPIHVGHLPRQGVAVDLGHDVALLDMGGHVLARVPGELYYEWNVPGSVIVRTGPTFWLLRVGAGVVAPLPSRDAAIAIDPQFQTGVHLQRPGGSLPGVGRWAYALPGPRGLTLAQWSGECEVPNAMFVSPGSPPRAVTGELGLHGPESQGLGWDSRGRAIVYLEEGECGISFERPGIYAFTEPGKGEPISLRPGIVSARMWGGTD